MRQLALRVPCTRHPVLALARRMAGWAVRCLPRLVAGRRLHTQGDIDLAQRVRESGEW